MILYNITSHSLLPFNYKKKIQEMIISIITLFKTSCCNLDRKVICSICKLMNLYNKYFIIIFNEIFMVIFKNKFSCLSSKIMINSFEDLF